MELRGKKIANFSPGIVIAEIGSNHNGDIDLAKKLIDQAKAVGCDYVKFQSWSKDTLFARVVYDENYFLTDDYRNRTDYTLESIVDAYAVSEGELRELKAYCDEVGIGFSSTPFAQRELDFLVDELDVDFVKVASMDCNNYPFLKAVAAKGKPVILSTGLSTLSEVDKAIQTIEEAGNDQIIILHCVAIYPPADNIVHLRNIDLFQNTYPYPVGFSDHTLGTMIPLAALGRGACVLEKHFTLNKEMFGWDHKVSATQDELGVLVEASRRIPEALGSYRRVLSKADYEKIPAFRRSVVSARDIKAGEVIRREDLDLKRPARGVPPGDMHTVIGRVAKRDIPFDKVLDSDDY